MQRTICVNLPAGTDVRPVATLVQLANQYESRIYLESNHRSINAKSIMGVMSMALNNGDEVQISTEGPDESEAAERLASYLTGVQHE